MEPSLANSINIKDFNSICRICLSFRDNMISLSSGQVLLMLEECTAVQNEDNDKFPQQICKNCFWQLRNAYHFKRQCSVSLEILRNLLRQEDEDKNSMKLELVDSICDFDTISQEKLNASTSCDFDDLKLNLELKNESQTTIEFDTKNDESEKNEDFDDDNKDCLNDEIFENSSITDDDCGDNSLDNDIITETDKKDDSTQSKAQKQKSVADILMKKYNIYGLTCNICKKDLSNRFSMLRHMEVHDQNRSLKYHCKTCNKGFYAAENLKKHEIRHLGKTKYQCDHCPKRFYVLSALGVHCKSSHKAKPIQCRECSQQFYHPLQLEQHIQTHEEKKFICEDCGKIFPTRNRLTKHKKIHSDERPYKCEMCDSAFKQKFNLTIHMKLRHLECDRREMCNVCGKLFHPGSLRAHLETHNTDTIYKCQECGKVYANRIILAKHTNQKHKSCGPCKKYYCNICSKALGSSGSLRKHMIVMHTTLEKSECHICGKSYKSQNGVKVHILSAHMDERPYICQTCNKAFHSKNVLEKHMRTHTGERPFPCNICGKAFGFKQVLKTHMKVHAK